MGTVQILLIAWGCVTALLIGALIYRSMLETHEEDQIFLDPAGEKMANEQFALVKRIETLGRPITALWIVSGALLVAVAGMWLYQGFRSF